MTARQTAILWCDGEDCGRIHDAADETITQARRSAASAGWRLRRLQVVGLVDLCRACNLKAMDAALAAADSSAKSEGTDG